MEEVNSALEVSWSEYIARLVLTAVGVAPQPVIDERVQAWEQVAKHHSLKQCYAEERPLIESVFDRLTNLFELEQTVRELAPAPQPVTDEAALAEVRRQAAEEALNRYQGALAENEHAESWFKEDFISDIGEWAAAEYKKAEG